MSWVASGPDFAEAFENVARGAQAAAQALGEVLLPAMRKFADTFERMVWISTNDYIKTGEEPYGGIWSRHQMKSR
jgi:hypothetical protein